MVTAPASRPLWQGRTLALLGIVLFAFSLRSAVASLSPVLGYIRADFDVAAWVVGAIGTAPPVCYAVAGLLTPALERRLGLERLTALALVVVAGGLLARGLAADATGLTVVHVNRMIRALRRQNDIAWQDGSLALNNPAALARRVGRTATCVKEALV